MKKEDIEKKLKETKFYASGKDNTTTDEKGNVEYSKPLTGKEIAKAAVFSAGFFIVLGTAGKDVDPGYVYTAQDWLRGAAGLAMMVGSVDPARKQFVELTLAAVDKAMEMRDRLNIAILNVNKEDKFPDKLKSFIKGFNVKYNPNEKEEALEVHRDRKDGKEGSELSYINKAALNKKINEGM